MSSESVWLHPPDRHVRFFHSASVDAISESLSHTHTLGCCWLGQSLSSRTSGNRHAKGGVAAARNLSHMARLGIGSSSTGRWRERLADVFEGIEEHDLIADRSQSSCYYCHVCRLLSASLSLVSSSSRQAQHVVGTRNDEGRLQLRLRRLNNRLHRIHC